MKEERNPYWPWEMFGRSIWQLHEKDAEYQRGWYFIDETGDFNGPFNTREQAETAQRQHADSM